MAIRCLFLSGLFALSVGLSGCATTDAPSILQSQIAPVTHFDTQTLTVKDDEGLSYHFLLSSPLAKIKNPSEIIVVLDGDSLFGVGLRALRLNEVGLGGTPKGKVLAGVGYPDTLLFNPRRTQDYTQADKLNTLVNDKLLNHFAPYSPKKTLYGHSLGGLFALEVLKECIWDDCAYDHIVIASPSLWWQDEAVLKAWQSNQPPIKKEKLPKVTLTVGALEQTPKPNQDQTRANQVKQRKMLDNAKALSLRLNELGIDHRFIVHDNTGHQANAQVSLEKIIEE